jgi:hypothetical protein
MKLEEDLAYKLISRASDLNLSFIMKNIFKSFIKK